MIVTRSFSSDLTMRGDGRTVHGYAVPYDVEATINDGFGDYVETFQRGAFRNVVRAPFYTDFRYQHDDDLLAWIGNTLLLREEQRGLYGEWRLDDTERGKQVAYKIRDGQLPGLSVSFVPLKDDTTVLPSGMQRVSRRLIKKLDHVAAVRTPAYQSPEPLMIRTARAESSVDRWRSWRASVMLPSERPT